MEVGISVISEQEANYLDRPTVQVIGRPGQYIVELDVFHQLHCINDLRKILYPERFGGMDAITKNGTINRDDSEFKHWGE
jgi:hypothetical protein